MVRTSSRGSSRSRRIAPLVLAWLVLAGLMSTVGTVAPTPLPAGATPVQAVGLGTERVGSHPEDPAPYDEDTSTPPGARPGALPWYSSRDCGFSAPTLNQLARLYVFCDTTVEDALGNPRQAYFPYNTTALSPDPLYGPPKPRDPLIAGSTVVGNSIAFPSATETCASGYRPVVWPLSAATMPDYDGDTTTDRFAVYFRAYCVRLSPLDYDGRGVGVAFIETDTDLPHTHYSVGQGNSADYKYPVSGLVVGTSPFGVGANVVKTGTDRHLYLYRCDGTHAAGGGCYITRRLLAGTEGGDSTALGDGSGYQILRTDDTWGTGGTPKRLSDPSGTHSGDPLYEPFGARITWVPELARFVMTFNHRRRPPEDTSLQDYDSFGMMTAANIAGPWSDPIQVDMPADACDGNYCYASVAQPGITNRDQLGFTFYDQTMQRRPLGGSDGTLRAATIPLSSLGSVVAAGTTSNEAYVRWLYRHVLRRIASSADVTYWAGWLSTPGNTRSELVDALTSTSDFRRAWANLVFYDIWQYRRLDSTERATWDTYQTTNSFEDMERAIAASADTYTHITGEATPTAQGNEVFLQHLYQAAFNRAPDASGYAYWLSALNGGTSRSTAVGTFLTSTEARNLRVEMVFNLLLRRDPSSADLTYYRGLYATNGSLADLLVAVGGSSEAYTEAARPRSLPLE